MLPSMRYQLKLLVVFCAMHMADWDGASRRAADALDHAYGRDKAIATDACPMLTAYRRAAHDETMQASACLKALLASQMRDGSSLDLYIATFPRVSSPLLSLALRERIEPDFVRRLILLHRLPPVDRGNAEWPWPVKARALGRLELHVRGEAKKPAGKAQQRPMALLRALIAAGPDGAVLVRRGSVLLDTDSVWTDVDALVRLCERIDAIHPAAQAAVLVQCSQELLELYRGAFCDGDEESWMMPARDGLRTRFLGAAARLGTRLEKLGQASYRGLMRCACAQNDPAGAYSVYRQCRQTLSVVLGRMPSSETERLSFDLGIRNRD